MIKTVTYGQLRKVLTSLGCKPVHSDAGHFVFGDSKRDLLIILRNGDDAQLVRPADLVSVRRSLWGHGLIRDEEEEFDSLFLIRKGDRLVWTDPETGQERRVTAVAGESDGLVVVKQNGSLVPYPVNEVRRVKRTAPANGK